MTRSISQRCNESSIPTPSLKMGVRSDRPTAEADPLLQPGVHPYKVSENKLLFLAEHGYVLAGGTLCFLMGTVVSLVVVWIIILICNRQIAMERINTQSKVAGLYADFNGRSQAIKKPYVDLAKIFNCSSQTLTSTTDYGITDFPTAMALAYEAGMKFIQDILDSTAHNGLFTSIFTAAIIMLLIEVSCIVIFLAYENNWRGCKDAAPSTGTKYSFLIQGPKVLHHGVFEVTNSLSSAGVQVKTLLTRASQSFCSPNQVVEGAQDQRCCPSVSPLRYCREQSTEMTITVRPEKYSRPAKTGEDCGPLFETVQPHVPSHPLTWYPYRPESSQQCEEVDDSGNSNSVAPKTPPPFTEDLESGSVGLQTLREHLEKCRLLVPDFPDWESTHPEDIEQLSEDVTTPVSPDPRGPVRPSLQNPFDESSVSSKASELNKSSIIPDGQKNLSRVSEQRPPERMPSVRTQEVARQSVRFSNPPDTPDQPFKESLKEYEDYMSRQTLDMAVAQPLRISNIPATLQEEQRSSLKMTDAPRRSSGTAEEQRQSLQAIDGQKQSLQQRINSLQVPDYAQKKSMKEHEEHRKRDAAAAEYARSSKVYKEQIELQEQRQSAADKLKGSLKSTDEQRLPGSLKGSILKQSSLKGSPAATTDSQLPPTTPRRTLDVLSEETENSSSLSTPQMASPAWADPDTAPVIDRSHAEDSQPDSSANSERLAELVAKDTFEDDRV